MLWDNAPAVRARRPDRIALSLSALGASLAGALAVAAPSAVAASDCREGAATTAAVGRPAAASAWRAGVIARTPLWRSVPGRGGKRVGSIVPRQASWLLVLRAARDRQGRCWVRVRLPSRPNDATAWVNADRVLLEPTRWRIVISRAKRTLSVFHGGALRRRFRVVIGAPPTPTPGGLFSIVEVWRWKPSDFLGSYILPITAHSNVLQEFGGGDGRVGIHGRGGASLLDPLGAARSHGCIRLANSAIEWIVRKVGRSGLPGIPVRVR
jgi:lipoprotein-anchoring transpeptidase ErfK/SrfK